MTEFSTIDINGNPQTFQAKDAKKTPRIFLFIIIGITKRNLKKAVSIEQSILSQYFFTNKWSITLISRLKY